MAAATQSPVFDVLVFVWPRHFTLCANSKIISIDAELNHCIVTQGLQLWTRPSGTAGSPQAECWSMAQNGMARQASPQHCD